MRHEDSYRQAARAYRSGDSEKAIDLYERLAEQGDVESMVFAGYLRFKGPPGVRCLQRARAWFERAAKIGSERAELCLWHLCESENDRDASTMWLTRAAGKGCPGATYWLGRAMVRTEIPETNVGDGLRMLRAAAKAGHVFARKEYGRVLTGDPNSRRRYGDFC